MTIICQFMFLSEERKEKWGCSNGLLYRKWRDVDHLLLFSLCSLAISIERFNLSMNHCLSGRQVSIVPL